ncbi:LapA family protein [Pseudanabaena mucicola]|uniref:DUF1049 domain-containing protein n=1 Tax=Pseudanabaena mucicola FACHB-723 TaxID=2692860 RepID=A0ABR7ZXU1_9CYAN|nr:lipopolysaccharide assembly protein LapA domain-containing protein [Pseudanabaena mucicola]MBD2188793.1 DUF1049 domain-containing protein [Pseudanabaena mucicola FACHB-723]
MRLFLYVFLWILTLAIAIFASQNITTVSLRLFGFESIKLPLGLLLIFSAGLGATIASLSQTSIDLQTLTIPKLSVFSDKKNLFVKKTEAKTSTFKKNISVNRNRYKDDFDSDWDDDWD